jgi:hypothetical protein
VKDTVRKINRAKWAGGMAHVVKVLLSKNKALISNPSIAKKEKKIRRNTVYIL